MELHPKDGPYTAGTNTVMPESLGGSYCYNYLPSLSTTGLVLHMGMLMPSPGRTRYGVGSPLPPGWS